MSHAPAVLSLVALLLCAAPHARAAEPLVPLETDIPEEVLAGTPPEVLARLFPNLEKIPQGDRPDFLVPAGTVNVARGKRVTSSESDPILGRLAMVTDGNKEGSDTNFVELSPGKQWVQIDLEKRCTIRAVYLWHFFREARSYHDVVVQVSDDAAFTDAVKIVYSNDQDNSLGLGIGKRRPYMETNRGILIDAGGATGRFVRLYSAGNTANIMNHYVEVEVFGQPAEK